VCLETDSSIQNLMVGYTHTDTLNRRGRKEDGVISLLLFFQFKERRVTKSNIKMDKEMYLVLKKVTGFSFSECRLKN
jgi:hypothetical protein